MPIRLTDTNQAPKADHKGGSNRGREAERLRREIADLTYSLRHERWHLPINIWRMAEQRRRLRRELEAVEDTGN